MLLSNLKKVKKDRTDILFFSYETKTEIVRIWNQDVFIQFKEKGAFNQSVNCIFNDLWGKLKSCKVKDSIQVIENGEMYEIIINDHSVGTIPVITQKSEWDKYPVEEPLLRATAGKNLLDIAKKLEKQTINIAMYSLLHLAHSKNGYLFADNLVSLTRYDANYLKEEERNLKGFCGDFSFNPIYLKNIELFSSKEFQVVEFGDRVFFQNEDMFVGLKKNKYKLDKVAILSEMNGCEIPIQWTLSFKDAQQLLKDSISSTDKPIVCMANASGDGTIYVGEQKVGDVMSELQFTISFKECIDGFKTQWYIDDNYFYYKEKDGGKNEYLKIFKI